MKRIALGHWLAGLLAACALLPAHTAPLGAQLPAIPMEPIHDSGQSVTGAFEGWFSNPDGSISLLVGYLNRNAKETLEIPVGPNNRIEPGGPDMGQPTTFQPRRQWGVFTIKVPADFGNRKLTWTLVANGQSTSIPMSLNPLWIVTPYRDAGIGNTPPALKFAADGPAFTGPPIGIAQTLSVATGEALQLKLWASDDGVRPPEAAGRGGAPVTIFWSKYRGPGNVTFNNPRPPVDANGQSATAATFDQAGEYLLRVQANDSTGPGGGGFQCCWTNVQIKVDVH